MRRIVLLVLLAGLVLPAGAAKRATVTQLEQALAAAGAAHKQDAEVAHLVGGFEMSERLTSATLDRFAAKLSLGPRTALALQLLSNQSAFLDPPADEIPASGVPDPAIQQRIMDATRGFVTQILPRLPDFFATRTTSRFDDSPQELVKGDWPVRAGLHLLGTSSRDISFRDGREVQDAVKSAANSKPAKETGLTSWGEFGPVLAVILTDTAKGKVTWNHWEKSGGELAAVFNYAVPASASHYSVNYCCVRNGDFIERRQLTFRSRDQSPGQMANLPKTSDEHLFTETPGYHGTISIDPATGAVLRVTLEAELKQADPITRAAILVEYGRVAIGDRTYICPVRSLAFSMEQPNLNPGSGAPYIEGASGGSWTGQFATPHPVPTLLLNETTFTKYHRLRATARILGSTFEADSEGPAANPGSLPAIPQITVSQDNGAQAAVPESSAAATQTAEEANEKAAAAPPRPVPAPNPPEPVIPEVTMAENKGVPDQPTDPAPQQDASYSFKVSTRLVDVSVVVSDKKGRAVKDLKAEDFELYDNGRRVPIRYFTQFASDAGPVAESAGAAAANSPDPAPAGRQFSNRPNEAGSGASAAEPNTTVLLIDESHIAWGDLSNARRQLLEFLGKVAPGEPIGLYSMSSLGFKVLVEATTDHAALIARLKAWMPTAQSVSQAQDEEMRNRQLIDEVRSPEDLNNVNGNHVDSPDGETTTDPQLRTMGSNPARASLLILRNVARHLSAVSGHKNLVWVSSDNVFADWQSDAVGIEKNGKNIDSFAMHVQEAMNEAHVAVFPFDVSQLEAGSIGADLQHRNVELTQAAADTAALKGGPTGRDMRPGRITAQMQQDSHPIQGPIRQVAEATGGRTIRRSGDLAGALAGIVEDGHATYLLSFHPEEPADDKYHTIAVKLGGRHGLGLRYRTGYLYARDPVTLKERFQQAVWRPMDVTDLSVNATVAQMSQGANVKINIAATDLGLQQQAGRWMDKLDIFFIERDGSGTHARIDGQTLGLRLKASTYQALLPTGVPFEHFVQLRAGTASLRVMVVDENSGRIGSVTIPARALGGGS